MSLKSLSQSLPVWFALVCLLTPLVLAEPFTAKVTEVVKGDVLTINRDGKPDTVRLMGVDCPELAQPFGPEAKKFATDLVQGKEVKVDVQGTDEKGRPETVVTFSEDRVLNREILSAGLGWYDERHPGSDAPLRGLAAKAIAAKKGLWSDAAPLAPWDFRGDIVKPKLGTGPKLGAGETSVGRLSPSTIVFVNKDGREFHKASCLILDKSKQPLTLEEAQKAGYTPCTTCFPPKKDAETPKEAPKEAPKKGAKKEPAPVVAAKGDLESTGPPLDASQKQGASNLSGPQDVAKLLEDPIAKRLGVSLYKDANGQVTGVTAQNVSAEPVAALLGFQDGDILQQVNGDPINGEASLSQLYNKYKDAKSFQIQIQRNGQPVNLTINVPDFIR